MSDDDIGDAVYKILNENEFTSKEHTIDFITSKEFITQDSLTNKNHIGFYYTGDNELTIWPAKESKKIPIQSWR